MKEISKLTALLAAGLLALGTFSFVSCSNGGGESSDTNNTPVTKKVTTTTTTTITIKGTDYTYTTVDGTPQTSDSITVSDDGTITITADDESKLTIKGTSITYTTSDGKTYSGTSSDSSDIDSIVLTGDGENLTATSESETKTETVSSDSADSGTVRELSFTDLEGKIFNYKDDGEDRWYKFEDEKVYKISDKTYWSDKNYWTDKTSEWEVKGKSVALLNGTQYSVVGGKFLRTSGSGLYATFSGIFTKDGKSVTLSVTLKNNGTCTMTDSEETGSGTFTNNNGLLTMTMEDEAMYGFYDGSSIYMVDDLLTEEVVRELSFTDLEGKIFNYKKDNGDDRWYKFEDGKVYETTSLEYQNWNDKTSVWEEDGKSVALLNGTQYSVVEGKLPRTSGSGLYATFSETATEAGVSFTISATLKNDGTYTLTEPEGTGSGTFTNNNGLLAMARAGKTTLYGFYDGSSIYIVSKLLTEVTN